MSNSSILGLDVGGTKIALARYNRESLALEVQEAVPTKAKEGFSAVLDDIVALVNKHRTPETTAVGLGLPGLVKQPEGMLLNAPNIAHAKNIELKKILEERIKLPIVVENDANCFALAEAHAGAGKGKDVVLGVIVGTGVGGGIVINGKVFHGAHGYAAEFGHMLLVPGKPPYMTPDSRGEVEQFFSGTALGKRCEAAKRPEDYLQGDVCAFLRPEVFIEVAWMCATLTHLLDPSVIVFGGSTGRAFKPYLEPITEHLGKWVLPGTPLPELAISEIKDAGMLGAALLTL